MSVGQGGYPGGGFGPQGGAPGGGFGPQGGAPGGGFGPQGGAPGGGFGPQGGAPQGPPPKRSKLPLLLGVGCGVLLFVGLVCGGGMFACLSVATAPKDTVDAFLEAVRQGDYDRAYAQMDGEYRGSHSVESFRQAVQRLPGLATHRDTTLLRFRVQDDMGTVGGTLEQPDGSDVEVEFQLRSEEGGWRISEVRVGGHVLP